MKEIYETAVYCGRLKEWRILNLNTATIYSSSFETEAKALAAISEGEKRGDYIVRRIKLSDLRMAL